MSEQVKTSLFKESIYWKTLSTEVYDESGKEYRTTVKLTNIIFYNENGVVLDLGSGHFDNTNETFTFNGFVVLRRKENFNRKENFTIKTKNDGFLDDNYTLYIYEKNVDIKYIGLQKKYRSNVYRVYEVNGFEVLKYMKNLEEKIWSLKTKLETEIKKLDSYYLPLKEDELKKVCKNITKYNKMLLEEVEFVKNYEPKEEDFEE